MQAAYPTFTVPTNSRQYPRSGPTNKTNFSVVLICFVNARRNEVKLKNRKGFVLRQNSLNLGSPTRLRKVKKSEAM